MMVDVVQRNDSADGANEGGCSVGRENDSGYGADETNCRCSRGTAVHLTQNIVVQVMEFFSSAEGVEENM